MLYSKSNLNASISLYDICAEPHYIEVIPESDTQVTIRIENEDEQEVYKEKSHIAAWESLVYFANMILNQNELLKLKLIEH
jgi:hypothetical protein